MLILMTMYVQTETMQVDTDDKVCSYEASMITGDGGEIGGIQGRHVQGDLLLADT